MYKLLNKIRDIKSIQIFTVYVRYLIGGAFVISTFTLNKFGQYGDINKLPVVRFKFYKIGCAYY